MTKPWAKLHKCHELLKPRFPMERDTALDSGDVKDVKDPGSPRVLLKVCGCTNLSDLIEGTYISDQSFGKQVYKKHGASGFIYYWRSSPFRGWWIGPEAFGDKVWAYNGHSGNGQLPPFSRWNIPWDGAEDAQMRITFSVEGIGGLADLCLAEVQEKVMQMEESLATEATRRESVERIYFEKASDLLRSLEGIAFRLRSAYIFYIILLCKACS